jgi:hypothetical protein
MGANRRRWTTSKSGSKKQSFVGLHIKGRKPDKTPCFLQGENTPILLWINNLALLPSS